MAAVRRRLANEEGGAGIGAGRRYLLTQEAYEEELRRRFVAPMAKTKPAAEEPDEEITQFRRRLDKAIEGVR